MGRALSPSHKSKADLLATQNGQPALCQFLHSCKPQSHIPGPCCQEAGFSRPLVTHGEDGAHHRSDSQRCRRRFICSSNRGFNLGTSAHEHSHQVYVLFSCRPAGCFRLGCTLPEVERLTLCPPPPWGPSASSPRACLAHCTASGFAAQRQVTASPKPLGHPFPAQGPTA